jgi:hypothetical protein
MSDNKELHYRENATKHYKQATAWMLSIWGLPIGTAYFLLATCEFALAACHWSVGVLRWLANRY